MYFSELAEEMTGTPNCLYQLRDELLQSGKEVTDLVKGNVNEHGIVYPQDLLHEIVSQALESARVYRPDPFGQPVARQAIAHLYSDLRIDVKAQNVVLTPGTSVSYLYCFKLLAQPGSEILCPQPTYPLFDYIARLAGVTLTYYRLLEERDWAIDLEHLNSQVTAKTRAVVLISPHNPTGAVIDENQLSYLGVLMRRLNLPVISDEVFSHFLFKHDTLPRIAQTKAPLTFTLNGLSKMLALPQLKVGWMVVSGDDNLVKQATSALEVISDTFLPVNEVSQFAVPHLIAKGNEFLRQYRKAVSELRQVAMERLDGKRFVKPAGGFYVTVPVRRNEEEIALELLANEQVLVHPGYFYDIDGNHLVMTFIHERSRLERAFEKIRLYL